MIVLGDDRLKRVDQSGRGHGLSIYAVPVVCEMSEIMFVAIQYCHMIA